MGQYFLIVNVTKKEYIHPHCFNDGLKLGEQNFSIEIFNMLMINKETTKIFSAIINAAENYASYIFPSNLLGRWKDDEIVFSGDYSEKNKYYRQCIDDEKLEQLSKNSYTNIIDYFVGTNKKLTNKYNFVHKTKTYYYYNTEKKQCYIAIEKDDEYKNENYILYLISDHENNEYLWNFDKLIVSEKKISDHEKYSIVVIDKEPFF